jgi:hypothetical protein
VFALSLALGVDLLLGEAVRLCRAGTMGPSERDTAACDNLVKPRRANPAAFPAARCGIVFIDVVPWVRRRGRRPDIVHIIQWVCRRRGWPGVVHAIQWVCRRRWQTVFLLL